MHPCIYVHIYTYMQINIHTCKTETGYITQCYERHGNHIGQLSGFYAVEIYTCIDMIVTRDSTNLIFHDSPDDLKSYSQNVCSGDKSFTTACYYNKKCSIDRFLINTKPALLFGFPYFKKKEMGVTVIAISKSRIVTKTTQSLLFSSSFRIS